MDQINRVRGELERALLRNAIVTPSRFIDASTFTGEVYCDGTLVELAMRPNGKAAVKHVPEPASKPTVRLDGNWLYTGFIFEAFGHDLLEVSARLWPRLEESYDGVVCHRWRMASNGIQAARNATAGRILEAFGVPFNRVFVVDREVVTVDRLMVPEIAFRINDCAFPIFRSVIEHIGRSVDEEFGTRKIFLSRGRLDGDARRAYEASIVPAAEELGYTVIHPQLLTLDTQIGLMKGAAAIAGLDGSAMHLAAFCRPGTKVTCFDSRHVQNQFIIEDLFELDAQHINVATVAASIAREALAR